jgi:hypothetical protein
MSHSKKRRFYVRQAWAQNTDMPTISEFFGILIRMFWDPPRSTSMRSTASTKRSTTLQLWISSTGNYRAVLTLWLSSGLRGTKRN